MPATLESPPATTQQPSELLGMKEASTDKTQSNPQTEKKSFNTTAPDPFEELTKLSNDPVEKKEEPKPDQPKPEQPNPDEPKTEDPKPQDQKPDLKDDKQPEKPAGSAKELRNALENSKKEAARLRAELESIKKPKENEPDSKDLLAKLENESKRREELEKEMQFVNYEKSEEYKEKFQKPMEEAFNTAYSEIQELVMTEENGGTRKASIGDFNRLLGLGIQDAISQAKQWFGDAASEVLANRRRILEMDRNRKVAIDNFRKTGGEREKEFRIKQQQESNKLQNLWSSSVKEQIEKFPQFFGPIEGDQKGNELLEKGIQIADIAFSNNPEIPIEKRIALHATIRNKAAAFDRMAYQNKSLSDRIASLEKELEQFKASEPGKADGSKETVKAAKTAFDEIDELSRQ